MSLTEQSAAATASSCGRRSFLKGAGLLGIGAVAGIQASPMAASADEAAEEDATAEEAGSTGSISFTPGTYEASATGKNGPVNVAVTFTEDRIESIEILSHDETDDISYIPLNILPKIIVEAQTVDIDGVSGATLTSYAVKTAVSDAIAQAGGDSSLMPAFDPSVYTQAMTPGTYTGEAYGKWKQGSIEGERFGSPATIEPTTVEVTVDETSILEVKVTSCSDTPGFYEVATDRIPGDIVDQQSIFVDTVTGSTLTAFAVTSAVAKALEEAGADFAGFAKPSPRVEAEETYDADLCIIGGGTAGTTAALKAVEEGLKVVIMEKCQRISGEGSCATGALALGSKLGEEAGLEVTVDEVFTNMMEYAFWKTDANLTLNILERSGQMVDWLQGYWSESGWPGFTPPRNTTGDKITCDYGKGTEKFQILWDNYIIPGGATLLLETRGTSLIVEDGVVKGATGVKQDGTNVTVNAPAVLVCTGGFGGNKAMQEEILGSSFFYLNGVSTNVGEGINLCLDQGCILSTEVSPHLAEFCSNDVLDFYAGYMKFINQAGFLMVDPAGARYMNEIYPITHNLQRGATGMRRVGSNYIIFTQSDLDKLIATGIHEIVGDDLIAELQMRDRIIVPSYYTLQDEMDAALAHGQAWKADTLEELGEAVGFESDSWNETLDEYLTAIETGEDARFGKRPELLHPLSEGPFYAVRVISPIDGTYNGVRVDQKLRAIGPDYKPAPAGLFVAGQDSGGYFSYPYTDYAGATCGYALTSGMMSIEFIKEYLGK